MKSLGIAQYVPVESPVHRLEARAKLGLVLAFTACIFMVADFRGLALSGVVLAFAVIASRVPVAALFRGVRPVAFVMVFAILVRALQVGSGPVLGFSASGALEGTFFAMRILLLVLGASLVTLTTSPLDLTDAFERLLRPTARLGVPAPELAMMLSIALRFIPTTAEEAQKVVEAQRIRGARFDAGGPIARVKAWLPVLVPLFVHLFRRADRLAIAMEARCWRGGAGRTRIRHSVMRAADWTTLAVGVVACGAIGVLL